MINFRLFKAVLLFIVGATLLSLTISAQEDRKSKLSENNQLKAENFKLRVTLSQCQDTVNKTNLIAEQQKLIEQFRKDLNAGQDEKFNWDSFTFDSSNSSK